MKKYKYLKDINPQTFDRIERYLMDQMSHDQKTNFENEMAADTLLRNEVDLQRELITAVEVDFISKTLNDLDLDEQDMHQSKNLRPINSRINYFKFIGIAASIILIAAIGYFLLQQSNDLYNQYYEADPGLSTTMGEASNYEFYDGMVDYKMEKYDVAKNAWMPLQTKFPDNDTLNYYVAMADLNLNNFQESNKLLEKIPTTSVFYKDALWYQALIAVKHEDLETAKIKLESLETTKANKLRDEIQGK